MAENTIVVDLKPSLNREAYNTAYAQLEELKRIADSVEATIDRIGTKTAPKVTDPPEFGGLGAGMMTINGVEIPIEFHIDDVIRMPAWCNMKPDTVYHGHITKIDAAIVDVCPIFDVENDYRRAYLNPKYDGSTKFTISSDRGGIVLSGCCFMDAYVQRQLATAERPNGWFSGDLLFEFDDMCITWEVKPEDSNHRK